MSEAPPLLKIENLRKEYEIRSGAFAAAKERLVAVEDVSLTLGRGETLGLVGESGCGKTTLGRSLLRLIEPTAGRVRFDDEDVLALSGSRLRRLRRRMQIVFQDPYSSLNPRMKVKTLVGDALLVHRLARGGDLRDRVAESLEAVGLNSADMEKYPHQFSGGQRQRIGIARALILDPDFVLLDEPVSALDVSVRAQIINLLIDLRARRNLTYLFIAHDLAVVKHISSRVAVMYLGRIVELASSDRLYAAPAHPYTRLLMASVPIPDPARRKRTGRRGAKEEQNKTSPLLRPTGCAFHPRCPFAVGECRETVPPLREIEPGHFAACLRAEEVLESSGNHEDHGPA